MNFRLVLIGLLLFLFSTQVYALSDANLVAYYNFDETSGTTAFDAKNTSNGTITNAVINQVGKIGKAYSFDGDTDYVNTNSTFGFNGTKAITINAWVNTSTNRIFDGVIGSRGTVSQWSGITLYDSNTALSAIDASVGQGLCSFTNNSVPRNSWVMLTMTYDGTTIKNYVNGNLNSSCAYNGNQVVTNNFFIGVDSYSYSTRNFTGKIDEVSLWKRPLPIEDILELYNSGIGITYPFPLPIDLIASYDYNFNPSTQVAYLNNTSIDVNVTQTNWEWLQNGVLLSNLENTSFTATQNTDYNICLTVTGNEDGNALNILTDSVCQTITPWDTIAPTITASIEYGEGFITDYDINYSLTCEDNSSFVIYQVIKNDTNYLYNSVDAEGTLLEDTLTLTPPDHAQLTMICRDNYGNEARQSFGSIYALTLRLVNENTGEMFDLNKVVDAIAYTYDGNYVYDFKDTNTTNKNFFSPTNVIRLDFTYPDESATKISREINFNYLADQNVGICVAEYQQFYLYRFLSTSVKPVVVFNDYAKCYNLASTTKFLYNTYQSNTAYTINKPYYLYTYIDGVKSTLALLDGANNTEINLDILAFNQRTYNYVVDMDNIVFKPAQKDSNTIVFYYSSTTNNESVKLEIYNGTTLIWEYLENTDTNAFFVNFFYGDLGVVDSNLLKIVITKTYLGEETSFYRYFNTKAESYSGVLNPIVAIVLSFFVMFFGVTMVSYRFAMGWFGLFISLICIGILALAPPLDYIIFLQAIYFIIGLFIGIIGKEQTLGVQ